MGDVDFGFCKKGRLGANVRLNLRLLQVKLDTHKIEN